MKYFFTLLLMSCCLTAMAQNPNIESLQAFLNDSIVAKHIAQYSNVDTSYYVLKGKGEEFLISHGIVYDGINESTTPNYLTGKIKKIITYPGIAIIKIKFPDNKLSLKAKMERSCTCKPWRIKRRHIYTKPNKNTGKVTYWSFN